MSQPLPHSSDAYIRNIAGFHRPRASPTSERYSSIVPGATPNCPPVAEENGRISGFYGALSRPMVLRGRPIRVAVCCPFLVDTDHHKSLTALQLVKARLSGPQDLTLTDAATALARRVWIGIGGTVPL